MSSPTGGAPNTSGWSTILLPTIVWLILEVWQYIEWLIVKSTLVQGMTWCCQVTSHYLNQDLWCHMASPGQYKYNNVWIYCSATYEPFIITTSCLNNPSKKETKALIGQLGGHVVSEWRKDCTYLVMSSLSVTVKVRIFFNLFWVHAFETQNPIDSLALGRYGNDSNSVLSVDMLQIRFRSTSLKVLSGECHRTPLMISQHWFR